MTHVIRHQHLDIDFRGSEKDAVALQNRLSGWCRDSLMQMLERTFDRYVPDSEYWRMERLELDTGPIALDTLERDLPTLIERALEQALRGQTTATFFADSPTATLDNTSTQRTAVIHIDDVLAYFLSAGSFPWHFRLPTGRSFEETILDSWRQAPSAQVSGTLTNALVSATARERLIRQFSESLLAALAERLSPSLKQRADGIFARLDTAGIPVEVIRLFVLQVWDAVFSLAPYPDSYTETAILNVAWQALPQQTPDKRVLKTLLQHHWPIATLEDSAGRQAEPTESNHQPFDTEPASLRFETAKRSFKQKDKPEPETGDKPTSTVLSRNGEDVTATASALGVVPLHPDAAEGLYIENAGLVLLHPFLPQFFYALNVAESSAVTEPERALGLLHFLATGQPVAPEYELVLPKVLCNLPLTSPIETPVQLTTVEQEEADALLYAVINHWSVLKSTSIGGLRGTFLLRAGKLTLRDDGDWLLQVENQSFDILLNQLPWGYGAIKLPWMTSMLWVEWAS